MVHHQVVQRTPGQTVGHVLQEDAVHGLVHRVEQDGFFIQQQVGVVGDTVGHPVNSLKAAEPSVIRADPEQILPNVSDTIHANSLLPEGIVFQFSLPVSLV